MIGPTIPQWTSMTWVNACGPKDIDEEDVIRRDHEDCTYAVYHGIDGIFYCADGLCTHEQVHLAHGLFRDHEIECPKHNGLFDYRTGEALREPVCINLNTYETKVEGDQVLVMLT